MQHSGSSEEHFVRYTVADIMAAEPVTGWLWHGLLLPGTTTLLAGHWRVGKSTIIMTLLGAMFAGQPFLGLDTLRPERVVYFTEEGPYSLKAKVANTLAQQWPVEFWRARPGTNWGHVLQAIWDIGSGLVVIDTISEFAAVQDENSIEFGLRARQLSRVVRETSVSCLVVHHTSKWGSDDASGKTVRGHTSFPAVMDIVIVMRPEEGESNMGYIVTRSRFAETPAELAYQYYPGLDLVVPRDKRHQPGPQGRYSAEELRELVARYGSQRKVAKTLGISQSRISRILRQEETP